MARLKLVDIVALTALLGRVVTAQVGDASAACTEIKSQMSSSGPGTVLQSIVDLDFVSDIHHWFFVRSSQTPTCVVEVGSPEDVSMVMKTIAKYRAPWAVKSGGHASNPGFSSTTGVHISLTHFDQIVLSADKSTVEIGFGLTWADVYKTLDGSGVNVVGGRTVGPGVGGFTLGGGYSWKTNQYGLTSDGVKQFNVVLPNGTITAASADTNQDIFWALKGGLNKFGIVTSAVFYTHPQTDVYAGLGLYTGDAIDQVATATQTFSDTITDPKAQLITSLEGTAVGVGALVLFFYDGPDAGNSFAMFDDIASTAKMVYKQSFSSFISLVDSRIAATPRGSFDTLPTTTLTTGFISAVLNQSRTLSGIASAHSGLTAGFDIEPFLKYGQYATDSAFPHTDSQLPLNLYFSWMEEGDDDFWLQTIRSSVDQLKQVAIAEGIYNETAAIYPNYAGSNVTAEQLYSPAGAARLRAIRDAIDPTRIMDLAGGFTY